MSGIFIVNLQVVGSISPAFAPTQTIDQWSGLDNSNNDMSSDSQLPSVLNSVFSNNLLIPGEATVTQSTVANFRLHFDTLGSSISLDGSAPISFNSLPAGFVATSAKIQAVLINEVVTGNIVTAFLQKDASTEDSGHILSPGVVSTIQFPYNFGSFPVPIMLDIVSNGCGIRLNSDLVDPTPVVVALRYINIQGTYEIQSFHFSLDAIQPISDGDSITITSEDADMEKVTPLTDNGTVHITSRNTHRIIFIVTGITTRTITFSVVSTEFSGSVTLGTLLTILADASGIYTLTKNKINDTLYLHGSPEDTIDVAIPNPFIKTGFING